MISRTKYFNNYGKACLFVAGLKVDYGIMAKVEPTYPGGFIVVWEDPTGEYRF